MRAAVVSILVILLGVLPAAADSLLVGKVTDLLGQPVANVRVHVVTKGEHQVVTTNAAGEYTVAVDGNQTLSVVVGAGEFHTFRGGQIKDGTTMRLDFEVEQSDGEIIRIIDAKPPTVPPKLPADAPRVTPPYSTEAMERNAWAKAWLLLDIDETGKVLRVKLVKRPGFDLDDIAVKEAMKLKFQPALDENNKPMRTAIYWAMEWPAHGWLTMHQGTATRMPTESYALDPFAGNFGELKPTGVITLSSVPCAGSGPLNLDYKDPVYRDCSLPNVKKVPHLPWLDGTRPVPPDPAIIAIKPEAPLHLSRASYIPQIAGSVVTLGLVAATVVSFYKFNKYSDRMARYASYEPIEIDRDAIIRDRQGRDRWAKWSLVAMSAATASTALTLTLWFRHQRRSDFSVQPEDGGASVKMTGNF